MLIDRIECWGRQIHWGFTAARRRGELLQALSGVQEARTALEMLRSKSLMIPTQAGPVIGHDEVLDGAEHELECAERLLSAAIDYPSDDLV